MKKLAIFLTLISLLITGCFGKEIERKLAKDLKSSNAKVRLKAAKELGKVATPEAIRLLLLHKNDKSSRVREQIRKSLKKIDSRTFLN